jgi:protein-tyrosine kinase
MPPARPSVERRRRGLLERLGVRRRPHGLARDAGALNKRRIALLQPESFVAEQFRSLRARIDALATQHPLRTIGVTSATAGDGKSMAAIGLAVVSSMQVGRRVLLVDCDLRQPAVHHSLGLRPEAGLAEVLREEAKIEEAVVRAEGSQLDVLPVRSLPPNPSELLGSPRMRELFEELAGRYDRVVLDLPPALGLPDAKEVSGLCDGVVLVVRSGVTEAADVEGAVDVLGRERLIGTVLNGARIESSRYGYGR